MSMFRAIPLVLSLVLSACAPAYAAVPLLLNPPTSSQSILCIPEQYVAEYYSGDDAVGYSFTAMDVVKIMLGLIAQLGPLNDAKSQIPVATIWFVLDLSDDTAAAFLFDPHGCWIATADIFGNRGEAVDFFDQIGVMAPFGRGYSQLPGTPQAAPGSRF